MNDRKSETGNGMALDVLRAVLKSQYLAALQMLRDAIELCPDGEWTRADWENPFWRVAYHTLFFTHLYLQPNEPAFRAWESHREYYQILGALPWPPHDMPKIGEPYTREEVLSYCRVCEGMVNDAVDALDLLSPDCGFWWYGKMSKAEHQIVNVRHIQHHAGQLIDRVRAATGRGVEWRGSGSAE